MCMQCVGAVGTAFQAATLIGGPIALKYLQRVRAFFGLPDNSAAAVAARARALEAETTPSRERHSRHRSPPNPSGRCCNGGCSVSPASESPGRRRARARARATGGDRGPRTTRPGWVPGREASIPPGPARRGPRGTGISGRSPPVRHRRSAACPRRVVISPRNIGFSPDAEWISCPESLVRMTSLECGTGRAPLIEDPPPPLRGCPPPPPRGSPPESPRPAAELLRRLGAVSSARSRASCGASAASRPSRRGRRRGCRRPPAAASGPRAGALGAQPVVSA